MRSIPGALALILTSMSETAALSLASSRTIPLIIPTYSKSTTLFPQPRRHNIRNLGSQMNAAPASSAVSGEDEITPKKEGKDGGKLSFQTKYGRLNPFAIYYGTTAILLGLPWFVGLTLCKLFYKVTGERWDVNKRMPHFISHLWGMTLLRLSRSYPKVEGKEILSEFFSHGDENRAAMFVANHNSWMDIPFLGATVGIGQNYKFVSKAELIKVPILGTSIACGGHVMVDRLNRRSQVMAVKNGMGWLKKGVHLCTFPEGTRSKNGRVLSFKNGAFKMAQKVGAPIIPLSIVGSFDAHPPNWMFPRKASVSTCKVIVHEPIESSGMTEEELSNLVKAAIISGLPEEQHPIELEE